MTTKETEARPADIPLKCTRGEGVCGGTVLYTEEEDGGEWKCNLCSHIYVTKKRRLDWINLNFKKILQDVVFKGHRQALALNPVQSIDIKYLKEKYFEFYNELINKKQSQAFIPPNAEIKIITPPSKPVSSPKEPIRELEVGKDELFPFKDFLNKIMGMDKDVQLRLIDIYERQDSNHSKREIGKLLKASLRYEQNERYGEFVYTITPEVVRKLRKITGVDLGIK